ncbi:Hypp6111 [Branchiostoma lanceolatum]|uniref:Hypp6111 protein n=1 Tax=Branchiostoma lanceolatum TaxID=7740 RepID=A0A8J9W5W4_BRALA|nr:Hypp6111 [Branchiostoma lanceolatum]
MYASKRFAFSREVYGARCLLAAIDFNKDKDQPIVRRKREGKAHRSFQRKSDRWTYYNVKVPKDYREMEVNSRRRMVEMEEVKMQMMKRVTKVKERSQRETTS